MMEITEDNYSSRYSSQHLDLSVSRIPQLRGCSMAVGILIQSSDKPIFICFPYLWEKEFKEYWYYW